MISRLTRAFAAALAVLLITASAGGAHVLRMKDGRTIKGKFVGGTPTHVFFHVDGDTIRHYPVIDIVAIQIKEYTAQPATTAGKLTVPTGTALRLRTSSALGTSENRAGETFFGTLVEDFIFEGKVISRKGKRVFGRVIKVVRTERGVGNASIALEVAGLTIAGKKHPVISDAFVVENASGELSFPGEAAGINLSADRMADGRKIRILPGTVIEFHLRQPLTLRL